jgi:hypothetical protein
VEPVLKSEQELAFKEFLDTINSKGFKIFEQHLRSRQELYKRDIVQFLRSSEDNEIVAIKTRMAQQAIDIIENILTTHIDEIKDKINPERKKDYKLEAQGGQLY